MLRACKRSCKRGKAFHPSSFHSETRVTSRKTQRKNNAIERCLREEKEAGRRERNTGREWGREQDEELKIKINV